ncbi:uncharacterized protein LOC141721432 [Apium graveolens]|uniref:uncharacterized protein LOC141721432 n=1 Tax=Apium graveolens TaxID=4045 RepID=UPI003D7B2ABB
MSLFGGLECVFAVGCVRWLWKRCTYVGAYDSATWPKAEVDDFSAVPRFCKTILAIYEDDIRSPKLRPASEYGLNPDCVIMRANYKHTLGQCPPYLIYVDHDHREIVLAIRGLNLAKQTDYKVLLDNRLGKQMFDGGYVHFGLLKSAIWLLNQESERLKNLWIENGEEYDMVFVGHSLGSGIAALMTIIAVNHRDHLGGIPRNKIKCYSLAPARSMSLNLAVKYADVIHSVVLQDDFLPRTPTPLEDIFGSIFCLPCLLFLICLRDTFIPEHTKLSDPRRLYAPGRMYHIVERKFCRCGRFPPEVRTAIPVEGRFEHIVLSCNTTKDHGIIWIEREATKALEVMSESSSETTTTAPKPQKIQRLRTFEKEHRDALERAASLNIPHAVGSTDEEPTIHKKDGSSSGDEAAEISQNVTEDTQKTKPESAGGRVNWNEVVGMLFDRDESGKLLLKQDTLTRI